MNFLLVCGTSIVLLICAIGAFKVAVRAYFREKIAYLRTLQQIRRNKRTLN